MAVYGGFIEHEEGKSYGVFFPDFPGCISGGETMEEALRRAPEALRLHVESMLEDNDPIPVPTPFDRLVASEQYRDLVPFVVEVDTAKPKAVRLNITMDERLVSKIDTFASRLGKSRSAFLADAARLAMKE